MNLRTLTDDLRESVREASEQSLLSSLTETLRVLMDDAAPVGTKHKWADGRTWVKQRDGSWKPDLTSLPAGRKMLALPAGAPLKKPATGTVPAVVKKAGPSAPGKATADNLPDDPFKYFHKTPDAKLIPVSALRTIRARPEGIANAAKHMAKAFNGEGDKRKPVSLKDNGDGTYTVMDGNSTTAMARQHNWKNIVATVEPPDKKPATGSDEDIINSVREKGLSLRDAVKNGVKVKNKKTGEMETHHLAAGMSAEAHLALAKEFLGRHEKARAASEKKLKSLMPEGAEVSGRTKLPGSALGKLLRKPVKYKKVSDLQDGTGMRVVVKDTAALAQAVDALKKNYKIIESDDYVSEPQDGDKGLGYRSFHAIIEEDGLQKEVQLRTANQHTHAEWCHDIYKPANERQEAGKAAHEAVITQYARDIGDYLYALDSKKAAKKPDCPEPVAQYFHCL